MCMVWLVPAVYVSVVVGAFTSRRVGLRVIRELEDKLGEMWPIASPENSVSISAVRVPVTPTTGHIYHLFTSRDRLDKALPWEGGNYCWRPSKRLAPFLDSRARSEPASRDRPLALAYAYATFPVVSAAVCAIVLSCLTPVFGLGCRLLSFPPSFPFNYIG